MLTHSLLLLSDERGLVLKSETNASADYAELMLLKALAIVQRELLAARLGAPTPSGLVVAGRLPGGA